MRLEPFSELEHTSDLCLQVRGHDLKQLFCHAAQGMFSLMQGEPAGTPDRLTRVIELDALDVEMLLVDWLSELLYLAEVERVCFDTFEITTIEPTHLQATTKGRAPWRFARGIKAVTFFDLQVRRNSAGYYETEITFDV